jgi:hypothetical protein
LIPSIEGAQRSGAPSLFRILFGLLLPAQRNDDFTAIRENASLSMVNDIRPDLIGNIYLVVYMHIYTDKTTEHFNPLINH